MLFILAWLLWLYNSNHGNANSNKQQNEDGDKNKEPASLVAANEIEATLYGCKKENRDDLPLLREEEEYVKLGIPNKKPSEITPEEELYFQYAAANASLGSSFSGASLKNLYKNQKSAVSSADDIIQEYLLANSQSAVSDASSECLFIDENHRHQCEYRSKVEEQLRGSCQNNHAEHEGNQNSSEETKQLLEITEANSEFVNSVGNEEVFLQPAIPDVQCTVLTDVLENQFSKSANTKQLLEFTETHLDSVNSADNEEVFLQSTVTDAQCAASTDVFEDQLQESAKSKQILGNIETNSDSVNSVSKEEVLLHSTIPEVQCAVLTDVLEDQITGSTGEISLIEKSFTVIPAHSNERQPTPPTLPGHSCPVLNEAANSQSSLESPVVDGTLISTSDVTIEQCEIADLNKSGDASAMDDSKKNIVEDRNTQLHGSADAPHEDKTVDSNREVRDIDESIVIVGLPNENQSVSKSNLHDIFVNNAHTPNLNFENHLPNINNKSEQDNVLSNSHASIVVSSIGNSKLNTGDNYITENEFDDDSAIFSQREVTEKGEVAVVTMVGLPSEKGDDISQKNQILSEPRVINIEDRSPVSNIETKQSKIATSKIDRKENVGEKYSNKYLHKRNDSSDQETITTGIVHLKNHKGLQSSVEGFKKTVKLPKNSGGKMIVKKDPIGNSNVVHENPNSRNRLTVDVKSEKHVRKKSPPKKFLSNIKKVLKPKKNKTKTESLPDLSSAVESSNETLLSVVTGGKLKSSSTSGIDNLSFTEFTENEEGDGSLKPITASEELVTEEKELLSESGFKEEELDDDMKYRTPNGTHVSVTTESIGRIHSIVVGQGSPIGKTENTSKESTKIHKIPVLLAPCDTWSSENSYPVHEELVQEEVVEQDFVAVTEKEVNSVLHERTSTDTLEESKVDVILHDPEPITSSEDITTGNNNSENTEEKRQNLYEKLLAANKSKSEAGEITASTFSRVVESQTDKTSQPPPVGTKSKKAPPSPAKKPNKSESDDLPGKLKMQSSNRKPIKQIQQSEAEVTDFMTIMKKRKKYVDTMDNAGRLLGQIAHRDEKLYGGSKTISKNWRLIKDAVRRKEYLRFKNRPILKDVLGRPTEDIDYSRKFKV